jgi:hypothetical protein
MAGHLLEDGQRARRRRRGAQERTPESRRRQPGNRVRLGIGEVFFFFLRPGIGELGSGVG